LFDRLFGRFFSGFIMRKRIDFAGFGHPGDLEHHTVALPELVASLALVFCTLITATVVSIGIARADVVSNVIDNEGSVFVVALVLGLLFIGMGGLTILTLPHHPNKKSHS
jgi:hypothetical protein